MDAIYSRQSIDKKDSISIESQIQYCMKEVSGEHKVYIDKGYSGSNINRPDFVKMMQDIENGTISRVVVYKLDRISRSLLDFAHIIESFNKHKVEFISQTEKFDTSTSIGRAMLSIVMVFAQLERETIQQRVRDNYYQRGEKGLYLGGIAPFGYQKVEAVHHEKKTYKFEENEETAPIARNIYDMYIEDMKSLGEIARCLNAEEYKTRAGKNWSSSSVGRLLHNPVYVKANADVYLYLVSKGATMNNDISEFIGENGCYVYGERRSKSLSKFTNLRDNFVSIAPHKGIIEPDKWISCQYRLDKNKNLKNSGKGTHSWLSGLMKCGYCGYAMYVVISRGYAYINCGGRKIGFCKERKKVMYLKAIEYIVEMKLIEKLRTLKSEYKIEANYNNRQINELKIKLVRIEENINKLVDSLLTMSQVSSEYVNNKITELHNRKSQILGEINKLSIGSNVQKVSRDDLKEYLREWDSYNLGQKKKVAATLIEKINITDDEIEIIFKI